MSLHGSKDARWAGTGIDRDPYWTMVFECGVRVADALDMQEDAETIRYHFALARYPQLRDDPARFGSLGPQ